MNGHGGARPGAGRPSRMPYRKQTVVAYCLKPYQIAWVQRQARERGTSRSAIIRELIEEGRNK